MKLLMISGDRSILQGKRGAFWYTLEEFSKHWERIDVICPRVTSYELRAAGFESDSEPAARSPQPPLLPFTNVFFHPSPHGLWYQPWWILRKGKELTQQYQHAVMTVHEYPPFYNGLGARWLARVTGIPYAIEIHHIVGYPVASSIVEWIGRMMTRIWIRFDTAMSKRVRTVNHEVKAMLIRFSVTLSKLHVVPSFYLDRTQLHPDPSIPKIYDVVFCARLVPNKGLRSLLDALKTIPDAHLLVIGDGPHRGACEQHAKKLGIADRVTFAGWLNSQSEVMQAIQSAKVFVMNSRSEGGPRVALEAMACGMPVITTPVGVMPEVIRDGMNGIMTTGLTRHLADSIRLLLRDEHLRERVGKAAASIIDRFDRQTLIKEYVKFLQEIPRFVPNKIRRGTI